jgi:hypothetical protein
MEPGFNLPPELQSSLASILAQQQHTSGAQGMDWEAPGVEPKVDDESQRYGPWFPLSRAGRSTSSLTLCMTQPKEGKGRVKEKGLFSCRSFTLNF